MIEQNGDASLKNQIIYLNEPIPVAEWFEVGGHGRLFAGIAGLNTVVGDMDTTVYYECCVLSGSGLLDGGIFPPEDSCRMWLCLSAIVNLL